MGGRNKEYATEDQVLWHKRSYEKGWIAPHWEKKYGGGGLRVKYTSIIAEELAKYGARLPLVGMGVFMIGPAILKFGTEEQKMKYLNEIRPHSSIGYKTPNELENLNQNLYFKAVVA